MACGCKGGGNGWNYIAPNGQTTTYRTEVEARAAMIRAGKVGQVKQAP